MQEIVIANEIASISCMAYYGYTGWIAFANIRFSIVLLVILIPCQPVFQ